MSGTHKPKNHAGKAAVARGKARIIKDVLAGKDVLAVMPYWRSQAPIYKVPAMQLPGLTLVISPTFLRNRAEVERLQKRGIPATFIHGLLPEQKERECFEELAQGKYKIVYALSERLRSPDFLEALQGTKISLLAVNEAQSACPWDRDFRPEYALIPGLRQKIGSPPILASAIAGPPVQQEVLKTLCPNHPRRVVCQIDLPNVDYSVQRERNYAAKLAVLRDMISEVDDGGVIVYVDSRPHAERVLKELRAIEGLQAEWYHYRLPREQRSAIERSFRRGDLDVLVMISGIGLEIVRRDVRLVAHLTMPTSMDAYYREAGHAGRDGTAARAALFYTPHDRGTLEYLINSSVPRVAELHSLFHTVCAGQALAKTVSLRRLSRAIQFPPGMLSIALTHLEAAGMVARADAAGRSFKLLKDTWCETRAEQQAVHLVRYHKYRWEQLEEMVAYAESPTKHSEMLLGHFEGAGPTLNLQVKARTRPLDVGESRLLTLGFLKKGRSPSQIAKQRGLSESTIWEHASRLIAERKIELDALVAKGAKKKILDAIKQVGDVSRLAPIKEALPESISYDEIRCVIAAQHGHP